MSNAVLIARKFGDICNTARDKENKCALIHMNIIQEQFFTKDKIIVILYKLQNGMHPYFVFLCYSFYYF